MCYINFLGISFCLLLNVSAYSSEKIEDIINDSAIPLMTWQTHRDNKGNFTLDNEKPIKKALSRAKLESNNNQNIIKFLLSRQKEDEEIDKSDLKKNNTSKLVNFFQKNNILEGKNLEQCIIIIKETQEFLKNCGFEIFEQDLTTTNN